MDNPHSQFTFIVCEHPFRLTVAVVNLSNLEFNHNIEYSVGVLISELRLELSVLLRSTVSQINHTDIQSRIIQNNMGIINRKQKVMTRCNTNNFQYLDRVPAVARHCRQLAIILKSGDYFFQKARKNGESLNEKVGAFL